MYADEMDYWFYREYNLATDEHQWKDFMLADWAWDQVAYAIAVIGFLAMPKSSVHLILCDLQALTIGFIYKAARLYPKDPRFRKFY
jgi:hypothetical protein